AKGDLLQGDLREILDSPIANYAEFVHRVFERYAAGRGKARWGDKTPVYVTDIDVIARLFPESKIIHLVRDGRDVALSMRKLGWGSTRLPDLAREWAWKTTLAHKVGVVLGERFLEIRFEELVHEAESTLRRVCGFLDEEFAPSMLEFHHLGAT